MGAGVTYGWPPLCFAPSSIDTNPNNPTNTRTGGTLLVKGLRQAVSLAVHVAEGASRKYDERLCQTKGHKWDWSHGLGTPGVGMARCMRCPAVHMPGPRPRGAQTAAKGLRAGQTGAGLGIALETAQMAARAATAVARALPAPPLRPWQGHSGGQGPQCGGGR